MIAFDSFYVWHQSSWIYSRWFLIWPKDSPDDLNDRSERWLFSLSPIVCHFINLYEYQASALKQTHVNIYDACNLKTRASHEPHPSRAAAVKHVFHGTHPRASFWQEICIEPWWTSHHSSPWLGYGQQELHPLQQLDALHGSKLNKTSSLVSSQVCSLCWWRTCCHHRCKMCSWVEKEHGLTFLPCVVTL